METFHVLHNHIKKKRIGLTLQNRNIWKESQIILAKFAKSILENLTNGDIRRLYTLDLSVQAINQPDGEALVSDMIYRFNISVPVYKFYVQLIRNLKRNIKTQQNIFTKAIESDTEVKS